MKNVAVIFTHMFCPDAVYQNGSWKDESHQQENGVLQNEILVCDLIELHYVT